MSKKEPILIFNHELEGSKGQLFDKTSCRYCSVADSRFNCRREFYFKSKHSDHEGLCTITNDKEERLTDNPYGNLIELKELPDG